MATIIPIRFGHGGPPQHKRTDDYIYGTVLWIPADSKLLVFYRDPELEMKVSPELAELWRKTEIPRDPAELDAALTAAMLEPMIKDR